MMLDDFGWRKNCKNFFSDELAHLAYLLRSKNNK